MGLFKSIGDFLFGKDPDIFDEKGRVRHNFPEDKWKAWDDRLKANPQYDWRQHKGKETALRGTSKANGPGNGTTPNT